MRAFSTLIVVLLAAIQYPLWLGKGGWLRVVELRTQLDDQRAANQAATFRNTSLKAELLSLNAGQEAVEEQARHQLHMVKTDELFFQWVEPSANTSTTEASAVKSKP